MEQTERFENKLENFRKAVKNFENSLSLNLNEFEEIEFDTIKSGQIQKFEFCVELCWKTIKEFLNEKHGIDVFSPKSTFKEFFSLNLIDENKYENLIEMLEDRNKLSHIYEEMFFEEIYKKLHIYLNTFKIVLKIINK